MAQAMTGSPEYTKGTPEIPDFSLETLEQNLGFKFPEFSIAKLEENLGFTLPKLDGTYWDEDYSTSVPNTTTILTHEQDLYTPSPPTEITEFLEPHPAVKETPLKPHRSRLSKFGQKIATFATVAGMGVTGFVGVGVAQEKLFNPTQTEQGAWDTQSTPDAEPMMSSRPTTSTTPETISTTTPEAPVVTYEAEVGEEIGLILSPAECNIIVHLKQVTVEQEMQMGDVNRTSPLDERSLLPSELRRVQECAEEVIERANSMGYPTRPERDRFARNKSLYPTIDGQQTTAGDYKAIAGLSISVYPGQRGNIVVFGHGSTESSPYNDAGALKRGDKKYILRSDGMILEYTVLGEQELIPVNNKTTDLIYNYTEGIDPSTGEYNASYLTEYYCVGADGRPGSDTHRAVVRSVMTNDSLTWDDLQDKLGPEYAEILKKTVANSEVDYTIFKS